jgi:hypothetical protein
MPMRSHLLGLPFFCGLLFLTTLRAADDYKLGPDSMEQQGVPKGKVLKQEPWKSKIFDGTVRDWWLYVPEQYQDSTPACVMVFQDGGSYMNDKGQFRVPVVFDNLIHKKEMPVTIGIFLNPGNIPAADQGQKARSNRSFEYDTLSDQYARFLEKEILPEVAKTYKLLAASAPAASALSRWPGNGPISSARCCRTSAASPIFAAATCIPAWSARRRRSPFAFSCKTAPATSTTCTATGRWPTSRWRRPSSSPSTITSSSTATAATTASTVGRSCPNP